MKRIIPPAASAEWYVTMGMTRVPKFARILPKARVRDTTSCSDRLRYITESGLLTSSALAD